jgi:CRP/FNR family cyclic AMP-dependent transcriptional regulator
MRNLQLIDKAFFLKKNSLFSSLDLDLLLTIADKTESLFFHSTDTIFRQGQEAHRMYLITAGHVSVEDTNGVPFAELSVGDFFGDEAMFTIKKREYAVRCKTKVELLALSRSHLLSIIYECPSVAISLLEAYTSHLTFRTRQ